MKKVSKKIVAVFSAVLMLLPLISVYAAEAEENNALSRGRVVEMLLEAADDYNPEVRKNDIIKGYEDGELHEDRNVTRAEALVMLKRAFGELPKPVGHNLRVAIPADDFTDIPDWAKTELSNIFDAGIVAGTAPGIFSPDENITEEQMKLFINRVFALLGTNKKDDFYSVANKEYLDNSELKPGRMKFGPVYEVGDLVMEQLDNIMSEMLANSYEKGTHEQKMADFYRTALDKESRKNAGFEPIKPYIELIDNAKSVDELIDAQIAIFEQTCCYQFFTFNLDGDFEDSTKNILCFNTDGPELDKSFYTDADDAKKQIYIDYIKDRLALIDDNSSVSPEEVIAFEKKLSEKKLDPEGYYDVSLTNNIYTFDQLNELFCFDLEKVLNCCGLEKEDRILVPDKDLVEEYARLFTNENLDVLKTKAKLILLSDFGDLLSDDYINIKNGFNRDFWGAEGTYTDEELALLAVENYMSDYFGQKYVEKYFSEEKKADVTEMIKDMIEVYKNRISNIDWMSEKTKAEALKKLETMVIKVGYPDKWDTALDDVEIKSPEEGGSYFSNWIAINHARFIDNTKMQGKPVDKSKWELNTFTVNACYTSYTNSITFPAAFLQAPIYDPSKSYEYNLGAVGFCIAHEITHAFDNNGAQFDENGNAADWWTEEDYAAFTKLCEDMIALYDGYEYAPGIHINGTLTLSENVADQGAISCILEIASKLEDPDYNELFNSVATVLTISVPREYAEYLANTNVHALGRGRINPVLFNSPKFMEFYDISERDGMYLAPEKRVKIW